MELTIAQQQLEIQLYQKMASDEAVASRAIYWLQEKIQMQQWESKQQLLEIQQLNDQLASHDAAARRDISSLEVELKQMTNQVYCWNRLCTNIYISIEHKENLVLDIDVHVDNFVKTKITLWEF